jgi:peptide/nickel transport system permease protein
MSATSLAPEDSKLSLGKQGKETETQKDESFYRAGQWQLVWWKFRRHKLARLAMIVLGIFYFCAIFAEILTPYDPLHRMKEFAAMPPVTIHLTDAQGNFHLPFVYQLKMARDPNTLRPMYTEDTSAIHPIKFFVHGDP